MLTNWVRLCRLVSMLGILLALSRGAVRAAEPALVADLTPTAPPTVKAVRATAAPAIDGRLDDACWQEASHLTGFWRERVSGPPLEPTEAWVCYDSEGLYFAFRCADSRPSEIRADQKKRQGQIFQDDRVMVALDVSNSGQTFYIFQVTPAGTQYDQVPGGTSEKIEWKGDWRAAASVDEGGWTAEIAVPFSILRYPNGHDSFGLILVRVLAREQDACLWPRAFAQVEDTANRARWSGIATPPVPFRYVLMPYALSVYSANEEERQPLTAGLDAKGVFPNGAVALATYHPDFSNLEDVVETIDFTYVERYLPEYRPFFQEGQWYLPPSTVLYTRRIEELDFGAKAFGTLGNHQFGVLDAYSREGDNHFAGAYTHLFGTSGSARLSLVDRVVSGEPDNAAFGVDLGGSRSFQGGGRYAFASLFRSATQGPGGDGTWLDCGTGMNKMQGWNYHVGYNAVGEQFRADDGYLPETGVRSLFSEVRYVRQPETGPLRFQEWATGFSVGESQQGDRRSVRLNHSREWRSGLAIWAGGGGGERDGYDESTRFVGGQWNNRDIYRRGTFDYTWGTRYDLPYRYQSVGKCFRPSDRWAAEVRAERAYAAELDDAGVVQPPQVRRQFLLTATFDITDERTVSARLVRSGGATNMYAAYRQRVRRGADLLVVLGDPNAEQWVNRLAIKAIWCL